MTGTVEPTASPATPRPATLVVLAWNQWELTRRCLESLCATDLSGAEVLVVDNGSTDETPQRARRAGSRRRLRVATPGREPRLRARQQRRHRGRRPGIRRRAAQQRPRVSTSPTGSSACAPAPTRPPDVGVVGCRLVRRRRPAAPRRHLHPARHRVGPADRLAANRTSASFPAIATVEGIVFACAYLRARS